MIIKGVPVCIFCTLWQLQLEPRASLHFLSSPLHLYCIPSSPPPLPSHTHDPFLLSPWPHLPSQPDCISTHTSRAVLVAASSFVLGDANLHPSVKHSCKYLWFLQCAKEEGDRGAQGLGGVIGQESRGSDGTHLVPRDPAAWGIGRMHSTFRDLFVGCAPVVSISLVCLFG